MIKFFAWIAGIGILIIIVASILGAFADTSRTLHREYSASALLKKYESFKDMSAAIDAKRADINLYEEELNGYHINNDDDRFYYEQKKSEVMGIIMVHNRLCSEYNSAMSKFNYRFTNKGDLPQSNLEPLPREYKPYILSLKSNTKQ